MTILPRLPKLLKGDIVLGDPANRTVQRIQQLQNSPDSLAGSWKEGVSAKSTDRSGVFRLTRSTRGAIRLDVVGDARGYL
jgi:hypothetical protein